MTWYSLINKSQSASGTMGTMSWQHIHFSLWSNGSHSPLPFNQRIIYHAITGPHSKAPALVNNNHSKLLNYRFHFFISLVYSVFVYSTFHVLSAAYTMPSIVTFCTALLYKLVLMFHSFCCNVDWWCQLFCFDILFFSNHFTPNITAKWAVCI